MMSAIRNSQCNLPGKVLVLLKNETKQREFSLERATNDSRKSGYAPWAVVQEVDCEEDLVFRSFPNSLCIPVFSRYPTVTNRPTCCLRVMDMRRKIKDARRREEVFVFCPPFFFICKKRKNNILKGKDDYEIQGCQFLITSRIFCLW